MSKAPSPRPMSRSTSSNNSPSRARPTNGSRINDTDETLDAAGGELPHPRALGTRPNRLARWRAQSFGCSPPNDPPPTGLGRYGSDRPHTHARHYPVGRHPADANIQLRRCQHAATTRVRKTPCLLTDLLELRRGGGDRRGRRDLDGRPLAIGEDVGF